MERRRRGVNNLFKILEKAVGPEISSKAAQCSKDLVSLLTAFPFLMADDLDHLLSFFDPQFSFQ